MKYFIIFLSLCLYGNDINLNSFLEFNKKNYIPLLFDLNQSDNNKSDSVLLEEEDLNYSIVSVHEIKNISVIVNKNRFYKFLPSFINSLNAYLIQKGIDYNLTIYNIDKNISEIRSKYILYVDIDANLSYLSSLKNKIFYLPLINRDEVNFSSSNLYFGGIDFKAQVKKLSEFVDSEAVAITSYTMLGRKLTLYEKQFTNIDNVFYFPRINYDELIGKYIFLNMSSTNIAQVLSEITSRRVDINLALVSQIGYDPLLISLTQPRDIEKVVIVNSIEESPLTIRDYVFLLNSDIRFNFLNYAANVLLNSALNDNKFNYQNDFAVYIFNHQIDYSNKLYIIDRGAFKILE